MIFSSMLVIPATTLASCSTYNTNYITSAFYNSYDMLTALGIAPKTQAYANKGLNKKYWKHLDGHVNENITNFAVFGQSSSRPNLAQLKTFKTDTLVLNEWAKPNEIEYIGPKNSGAKKVVYTSMGDSALSRYDEETSTGKDPNIDWHTYKSGLFSYRAATKMLAKDLDKYFLPNPNFVGGEKFYSYSDRAESIFLKDIERINKIREQVQQSSLKDKTIGIFAGQEGGGGSYLPAKSLTAIYEPFLYPQIYGPENIGFGLKFPKPVENTGKELKWADDGNLASISAKDPSILKESFKNKFDYIIYVKSPDVNGEGLSLEKQYEKFEIKEFFKTTSLISTKNTNSENSFEQVNDKKFVAVDYEDWYPTAWGPIGVSKLVSEMVRVLNIFLTNNSSNKESTQTTTITDNGPKWEFYEPKDHWNQELVF